VTTFGHPVAWRRVGAPRHYTGSLELDAEALVLTGSEPSTGLGATIRIPRAAVRGMRFAVRDEEEIVGVRGLVLELADDVPILLRQLGLESPDEQELAVALSSALDLAPPQLHR
jgi:hypothetical protein